MTIRSVDPRLAAALAAFKRTAFETSPPEVMTFIDDLDPGEARTIDGTFRVDLAIAAAIAAWLAADPAPPDRETRRTTRRTPRITR